MQARKSLFVGLILLAPVAFAQTKPQKTPQLLLNAQYVYVEPLLDDGKFADPNVSPEDRQAVTNVTYAMFTLRPPAALPKPKPAQLPAAKPDQNRIFSAFLR